MHKSKTPKKQSKPQQNTSDAVKPFFIIAISLIVIITCGVYLKSLNNDFVNWDDEQYVYKNASITTLHGDSIGYTLKKTFTEFVVGNYHPLTMLTYCIEYNISGLNPKTYHTTNLILHILNNILVLIFIWLLSKQKHTALAVALLFAVHPMHVESVTWVSERKDVLYAFFYLASLCSYILYVKSTDKKTGLYLLTLVLFILALLSKAMAVTLPVVFILIDYYLNIPINIKSQKNKIPFLFLSILFGIIAIKAQMAFNAISGNAVFPLHERFLFACYGIVHYIIKLFLPTNLSCFYPYPVKHDNSLPTMYYIAPFILLGLIFTLFKFFRSNKQVIFGSLFFIITIALVLQIISVGEAVVADRYTYLPYIGLFFIINSGIQSLSHFNKFKNLYITGFALIVIIYGYAAHKRSLVWKNGLTLWENALQNSAPSYTAYYCRGNALATNNEHAKAIEDFNSAEKMRTTDYNLYYSRGYSYYFLQQYKLAINDFSIALKLNPNIFDAYLTRGGAYYQLKQFDEAIEDYNYVLTLNPNHAPTYCNRSITFLFTGQYEKAMQDALKASELGFSVPPQLIKDIEIGIKSRTKPVD
jgi:protein O-mannosyl-transferase